MEFFTGILVRNGFGCKGHVWKSAIHSEAVDVAKETGGKGLASMRFEASPYEGRRFEFSCVDGGAIEIENFEGKPLVGGMLISWHSDPKKDTEAKARLEISIR